MVLHRCDKCEKPLNSTKADYLEMSLGWHPGFELCEDCAKPVIEALERFKLLPEKLLKSLEFAPD